jgi:hypothetical protein
MSDLTIEYKDLKSNNIIEENNIDKIKTKFPKILIYVSVFIFLFTIGSTGPTILLVIYMRNFVGLSSKTVTTIIHVSGTIGIFNIVSFYLNKFKILF